jgi:hypothetical protein
MAVRNASLYFASNAGQESGLCLLILIAYTVSLLLSDAPSYRAALSLSDLQALEACGNERMSSMSTHWQQSGNSGLSWI